MAEVDILRIDDKEYLSFQDACCYLACCADTLRELIHSGQVPVTQIGSRKVFEVVVLDAVALERAHKVKGVI